ncbi:UNVERIFIED_CONTAM: hypothetical protein RMT77_005781 [Armadillidium vulgare]
MKILVLLLFTVLVCASANADAEPKAEAKPAANPEYPVSAGLRILLNNAIGIPPSTINSLYSNEGRGIITSPYNTGYLYGNNLYNGNVLGLYGGYGSSILPNYGFTQRHNLYYGINSYPYGIGSIPQYGINTLIPNQVYGNNLGTLGFPFIQNAYQPHLNQGTLFSGLPNQGIVPSYLHNPIHPPITGISTVQHNQYHPSSRGYRTEVNKIRPPGNDYGYKRINKQIRYSPLLNTVKIDSKEYKNKGQRFFGKAGYDSYSSIEYS